MAAEVSRADRARESSGEPDRPTEGHTTAVVRGKDARARAREARADAPQGTRGLVWEASSAHARHEGQKGGRKRSLRRRSEALRLGGAIPIVFEEATCCPLSSWDGGQESQVHVTMWREWPPRWFLGA